MVYQWKSGAQIKVSADVAGAEIERVRMKHGGFYKPTDLVDASRPKKAPLHDEFEWDDTVAAEAHRAEQARYITRCIVRVERHEDEPEQEPVRAFVSVMREDEDSRRTPFYTSIVLAMSDADMRKQLLNEALADIRQFEKKYVSLEIFADLFTEMKRVRRSI